MSSDEGWQVAKGNHRGRSRGRRGGAGRGEGRGNDQGGRGGGGSGSQTYGNAGNYSEESDGDRGRGGGLEDRRDRDHYGGGIPHQPRNIGNNPPGNIPSSNQDSSIPRQPRTFGNNSFSNRGSSSQGRSAPHWQESFSNNQRGQRDNSTPGRHQPRNFGNNPPGDYFSSNQDRNVPRWHESFSNNQRGTRDNSTQRRGGSRGRGQFISNHRGTRGDGDSGASTIFSPGPFQPPSQEVQDAEDAMLVRQSAVGSQVTAIRPAYGTDGLPVVLRTNHFQIKIPDPNFRLYAYSVAIGPKPTVARKWKRAFELFIQKAECFKDLSPTIATDYRSIVISVKKLSLEDKQSYTLEYHEADADGPSDKAIKYVFAITFTRELAVQELLDSLKPGNTSQAIDKEIYVQALNIAMTRKAMDTPGVVKARNTNKFFPLGDPPPTALGGGLVALRGYYTSVRTSTLRLLLNVNSVTSAFYCDGPLLELMKQFRKKSDPSGHYDPALSRVLKGVRVELTHLKSKKDVFRVKTIYGFAAQDSTQAGFRWHEKDCNVSVEQYFFRHYTLTLKHPEEPVVNVGNGDHPVYIPPELCNVIPGQSANKKLSPEQTDKILAVACCPPAENAKRITERGASVLGLGSGITDGPIVFGMRIEPRMLTVPGRVLDPPAISYRAGRKSVDARLGGWNLRGQFLRVTPKTSNWSYSSIWDENVNPLKLPLNTIKEAFQEAMGKYGIPVDPPTPAAGFKHLSLGPNPNTHFNAVDRWLETVKNAGTRMLLILLPFKSQVLYAHIKYLADIKHGIHTICSLPDKWQDGSRDSYLANVLLKWNLKNGGVNQGLEAGNMGILLNGTMVVGVDVTHPSADSKEGTPSIAGVVASINKDFSQWPGDIRTQKSRKEIVDDLEQIMVDRLRLWQVHNDNALPKHILVYRDGVSEGQYSIVLEHEAKSIQMAIDLVYHSKAEKAKVAIIVVGKRHHTRFYPTKDETGTAVADKHGNPKNGTIVDRGVTSERYWDFYLQAHSGLQGTCRPAHYVVLKDEIDLGADQIQKLTHNLCYLYGRATKAVSICPPAYYADRICDRARCYLFEDLNDLDAASNRVRWGSGVDRNLRDTMFYV